jgi:hypothetical protein
VTSKPLPQVGDLCRDRHGPKVWHEVIRIERGIPVEITHVVVALRIPDTHGTRLSVFHKHIPLPEFWEQYGEPARWIRLDGEEE